MLRVRWPSSLPLKAHPPLLFSIPPVHHFCPLAMAISSADMRAMTDTLMSMMTQNNPKMVCLFGFVCLQLEIHSCRGVLIFAS